MSTNVDARPHAPSLNPHRGVTCRTLATSSDLRSSGSAFASFSHSSSEFQIGVVDADHDVARDVGEVLHHRGPWRVRLDLGSSQSSAS